MTDQENASDPPAIPAFPPSLLRAAEHLAAKFREMPWFIAVHPATVEGRICLRLQIKDRGVPPGMVLPTSFETFRVVIEKTGFTPMKVAPKKSGPSPLW